MGSLLFSVPYNNDPVTLDEIFQLDKNSKNKIVEIYFSGPQDYSGSGRITVKSDLKQFLKDVSEIHRHGIRVNLCLNTTCQGTDWYSPEYFRSLLEYIRIAHEENGVESVTVANPIHMQEIRRRFPNIEICTSVLSDIDCLQKAIVFKASGANVITPDTSINRDLKLLKQIKNTTGLKLRIMVNEGCLNKCPFRKFHFNYISHQSKEMNAGWDGHVSANNLFLGNCLGVTNWDHSQVLKSGWIRPEDTSKYASIADYFKIVGRTVKKDILIKTIKAYLDENWEGNLFDLLCSSLKTFSTGYGAFIDNKELGSYNFFETVTNCQHFCDSCNYCEITIRELLKFKGGKLAA